MSAIVFGGIAAIYSALLYDAAHPHFGEQRVRTLLDREAEAKQRRAVELAEQLERANEKSQASRDTMQAAWGAARARKEEARAEAPEL